MIPGQEKKVEVELNLKHGDNEYTITRHQFYKKTNSRLTTEGSVLRIQRKSSDGVVKILSRNTETEIKKILPKELARYFFFDGERIDKFSKEITKLVGKIAPRNQHKQESLKPIKATKQTKEEKIAQLKNELALAVKEERYEDAGKIKKQIQKLEAKDE
jgi:hypothetical protein